MGAHTGAPLIKIMMSQSTGRATAINSRTLLDIAKRYGTPLFVYEQSTLECSLADLKEGIGATTKVLYSVKANPNPTIIKLLHTLGCGIEVASWGELALSLECGVSPDQIVFAGPGKTDMELELAVRTRLQSINVESIGELHRLEAICQREGCRADVSLRLHPHAPVGPAGRLRAWRGTTPFGIDVGQLDEALEALWSLESLDCRGIHVHASSEVASAHALGELMEATIELGFSLEGRLPLKSINLGGGFSSPFYADDAKLDFSPIQRALASARERHQRLARGDVQLSVESGRAIVGPCGSFLTTVVDVKWCKGVKFAVLDGGINQNLRLSGAFRKIGKPVDVRVCREVQDCTLCEIELVGPLCTPIDRLASRALLPKDLAPGDVLAFRNAGAYTKYASPLTFLGHDWPAEVIVNHDGVRLIARRVSFLELFELQGARG